ncbi:MAG: hypothetical protein LBC52_06275 [Treponema sp.]|nr:hypothetical protein [Treponema sp.]
MEYRIRNTVFVLLFILSISTAFPQTDELLQRGSIPQELLRPRREEAPRYPVDTVIGPIGQGKAPAEAYGFARRVAAALLAGNMNAPVLSSVNKVFLEGFMSALNAVNPRYFRLGSGREEPDGSVSFLVRFAGREQGITGELFLRFEERMTNPPPPPVNSPVTEDEDGTAAETEQAPPAHVPIIEKRWIFENLILESPRSREEEIIENRQRYDFSPYERFF